MLNIFFIQKTKYILTTLVLAILVFAFLQSNTQLASAADKYKTDCKLSLTVDTTPKTVTTWNNPVIVKVTLSSDYTEGFQCNTKEVANVTLFWDTEAGITSLEEGIVIEMAANTGNKGAVRSESITRSYSLINGKEKRDATIKIGAHAVVSRNTSLVDNKTVNVNLNANWVTVKRDPNTKEPQNPAGATPPIITNTNTAPGADSKVRPPVEIAKITNPFGPSATTAQGVATRVINVLLALIVIAAVIVIVISGFRMVVGGSNPDQLKKAKAGILWSLVGLAVAFMSFAIVQIIQGIL